jgi:hypothetical protein
MLLFAAGGTKALLPHLCAQLLLLTQQVALKLYFPVSSSDGVVCTKWDKPHPLFITMDVLIAASGTTAQQWRRPRPWLSSSFSWYRATQPAVWWEG